MLSKTSFILKNIADNIREAKDFDVNSVRVIQQAQKIDPEKLFEVAREVYGYFHGTRTRESMLIYIVKVTGKYFKSIPELKKIYDMNEAVTKLKQEVGEKDNKIVNELEKIFGAPPDMDEIKSIFNTMHGHLYGEKDAGK